MTRVNLAISNNGTTASFAFPRDAQWSKFNVESFSFTLDEDIGDWDPSEKTYVYVDAGNYSPSVVLSSTAGSGYTVSANFLSMVGQYAQCNPGYTFRIRFGRNDRPAVIESAYIVYEGVEKENRWLIYNGNKLYKADDIVEAPNVTIDTRGQYYMTSYDYIQKILGHPDWTITSEYVLVTLDDSHEFYRDDITYYQGTIYPLYIYS